MLRVGGGVCSAAAAGREQGQGLAGGGVETQQHLGGPSQWSQMEARGWLSGLHPPLHGPVARGSSLQAGLFLGWGKPGQRPQHPSQVQSPVLQLSSYMTLTRFLILVQHTFQFPRLCKENL